MATAAEAREQAERDQLSISARMDQAHALVEELGQELNQLEHRLVPVLTPQDATPGLVSTADPGASPLSLNIRLLAERIEHMTTWVRELSQRVEL